MKRYQQSIIDSLVSKLDKGTNPSLKMYNKHIKYYEWLESLVKSGRLHKSDLPTKPAIEDYVPVKT